MQVCFVAHILSVMSHVVCTTQNLMFYTCTCTENLILVRFKSLFVISVPVLPSRQRQLKLETTLSCFKYGIQPVKKRSVH